MMCSDCACANFRLNNAPVGSGRSTFYCSTKCRWCTYADAGCVEWKPRHKEDKKNESI